jgi:hypothetical protein
MSEEKEVIQPHNVEVVCTVQCLWSHSDHDQEDVTHYKKNDKVTLPRVTAEGLEKAGIVKINK